MLKKLLKGGALFPFDGCRGLGRDVVEDAVDAFDFVEDLVADFSQEAVGQFHPVGCHGVFRDDGAEVGGEFVGTFVAFDSDGFDGDEAGVGLPDFVVPAVLLELANEDGIAIADDVEAVFGDGSRATYGKAGAGEGMAPQDVVLNAEGGSEGTDFVLEEFGQRFQHLALSLEFQDAGDAVVVRLDGGCLGLGVGCAFDDVGIEGTLGEDFGIADGIPEDIDEEFTDDFALFFRFRHASKCVEEAFRGIDGFDGNAHALEIGADFVGFIFAEESVVNEDGADIDLGFVQEDGEYGAVHAAGDAADDLLVADAFLDFANHLVLEVADVKLLEVLRGGEEVAQDGVAFVRVGDFRVELDAEAGVAPLQGDGYAALVAGNDAAVCGDMVNGVGVAHPDLGGRGDILVEAFAGAGAEVGGAVLALVAGLDGASVLDVEELHAVAHAQNGHVEGGQPSVVEVGRVGVGCALGAAGEDDCAGFNDLLQVFQSVQLGAVAEFAHAANNELGVLGAEVDDGNDVSVVHGDWVGKWGEGLAAVVDGLFRDLDVVRVAFFQTAGRDLDEASLFAKVGKVDGADVSHAGAEAAHELEGDVAEGTLERNAGFDAFSDEFAGAVLSVAVARATAHGADGTHAAVLLEVASLVVNHFARTFFRTGKEAAKHDEVGANGEGLDDVSRVADAAVCNDGDACGAGDAGHFLDGCELGHANAGDDARRADGAGAYAHFDGLDTGGNEVGSTFGGNDVTSDDGAVGEFAQLADYFHHAGGVASGCVDKEGVRTSFNESLGTFKVFGAYADGSAATEVAAGILGGIAEHGALLDVGFGDEASKAAIRIDERQFFDAVFVEDATGFFDGGGRCGRHQFVEVGHHVIDAGIHVVVDTAHIASGDDALELVVCIDDREAGETVFAHDVVHLGECHVLGNREGLRNNGVFKTLDAGDHGGLDVDGVVAMDDAKTTFSGEGDCQFGLGHGIHGSRENRNFQIETGNKLGAEISFTGEDGTLARQQEHVVKT